MKNFNILMTNFKPSIRKNQNFSEKHKIVMTIFKISMTKLK